MVDVSRVQKEIIECNRDQEVSGVSIVLHDGANISHLTGTIAGPADSRPLRGRNLRHRHSSPDEQPADPSSLDSPAPAPFSPRIPPVLCLPSPSSRVGDPIPLLRVIHGRDWFSWCGV
uniref:Uncharacterized protein n=1 Tax=Zea mays TaxID=4577 RepID=B6TDP0_MAIZE|nr:hypothetical protein [Zea mays]